MVKLTGPSLALSAAGSLANQLTFSSSKGTAYLKRKSKPSQPRTKPQVSLRAAMTFLSQEWPNITPIAKLTWPALAQQTNISPYNAFIAYNLDRHRNHQAVAMAHPAAELTSRATSITFVLTGHTRRLRFTFTIGNLNQNWGIILNHVAGTGVDPTWESPVRVIPTYSTGTIIWDWYPIAAGTYWFNDAWFTLTGLYQQIPRWRSATVTA